MAGQAHHFRRYAPKIEPDESKFAYGKERYTNEVGRLYGVLNRRLAERTGFQKGFALGAELRKPLDENSEKAEKTRKVLFGQKPV